jgi:hypothetical protein
MQKLALSCLQDDAQDWIRPENDSPKGDFGSVLEMEECEWGEDEDAALEAFAELSPAISDDMGVVEVQEKILEDRTNKREAEEHEMTRQEEQGRQQSKQQSKHQWAPEAEAELKSIELEKLKLEQEQALLLQKHHDLTIRASAAVVDAVAPPVPKALNLDSRSVLLRIFGEHEQNGVVNQQQMR